jgi:hypothetical protein
MPLTIAHPAAAIPLQKALKQYGILSALIIGSLVPDYAYFPYMPVDRIQSHSFLGMFWFCLPVGLITYYVFHGFMKKPLTSLLPAGLAGRFEPHTKSDSKVSKGLTFFAVCLSLWLGTATHLLWDSFTHEDGIAVSSIPFLQAQLFSIGSYDVIVYKILQHVSSIGGALLLAYWGFRWLQQSRSINTKGVKTNALPLWQRTLWISAIISIAVIVSIVSGYQAASGKRGILAIQTFEQNMLITGFTSVGILIIIYCLIYQFSFFLTNEKGR